MDTTLVASGVAAILAGSVYALLGRRLGARRVDGAPGLAWALFRTWWFGTALNLALAGAATLVAAVGILDLPLFLAHGHFERLVLVASLAALLGYVAYLVTGTRRAWVAIGAFYGAVYVYLIFTLHAGAPTSVSTFAWGRPSLAPSVVIPLWMRLATLAALIVPPLLGALAYLGMLRRVTDPTQRARILFVGCGFIAWYLSAFAAYLAPTNAALQVVNRVVGLGAAVAVYAAYLPPAWLAKRYRIVPLGEESAQSQRAPELAPKVAP